jgi:acyl-CoA synthetase (AMP-forming)/AMP-acid ligase II
MNLFDRFEQNALSHPNKPAFLYFDKHNWETFTYKNMLEETRRLISRLSACSLTPGLTAAVMTPPSLEFFPFALALLKLGIVPILLEPALGLKRIGKIYKESKPDIFVGNALTHALRAIFGWGRDSIKHNLSIAKIESGKSHREASLRKVESQSPISNYQSLSTFHSPLPTSPAAIIYTSGSTGLPKGAVYTQANLAAQLDLLKDTFEISQDEIDLPAFPLYALIDLLLGVTSVIPDITFPVPGKTDPKKVIDAIQKFHVTNMFASPVVLDHLSSFVLGGGAVIAPQTKQLSSLKRIITAGAPATISLQKRFRQLLDDSTSLFGIYGATETLPIAKVESREIFVLQGQTESGAGICLGKPIEGVTVRIIPITDDPIAEWQDSLTVKPNVIGEITVQSAATTRSYIQRPDADRISKIADRGEIIHRMGDVGYFDEEGRLWYCGRKSHRVQTKDDVFFTEQIENIFNAHPRVNRTALVGVEGEPVLWVELKNRLPKSIKTWEILDELKSLAAAHPQASRIQTFLFKKKFPTDVRHNSKIIREKLTELAYRHVSRIT